MDPLHASSSTSVQSTCLRRDPLTGLASTGAQCLRSEQASIAADEHIDLCEIATSQHIIVEGAPSNDRLTLEATAYDFALTPHGSFSLSLLAEASPLRSLIGRSVLTPTAGVAALGAKVAGVNTPSQTIGAVTDQIRAGLLEKDLRYSDRLGALDRSVAITRAVHGTIASAAGGFADSIDGLGDRLEAAWRWATGGHELRQERMIIGTSSPGDAGALVREARFVAPFAQAAYGIGGAPRTATPVDISAIFDPSDGFNAQLHREQQAGRDTLILAFRGTDDWQDWVTNLEHLARVPHQYAQAVTVAAAVQARYPNVDLILVGHSLGGGLASFAGLMTGTRTYAFNAAGPQQPTLQALPAGTNFDLVTHINTQSDPLTGFFGRIAGSPWGSRVCTLRDGAMPAITSHSDWLESLRARAEVVAQWMEHHRMNSAISRLETPSMELDCIRRR